MMIDTILQIAVLFVAGCGAGLVGGTLGVGGAIVVVPVLTHFLGLWHFDGELMVKATLANSLTTVIFAGIAASTKQYKMGNFHLRQSLATAWPGIISTLFVAWLISLSDWYSKEMFTFIFIGVLMLLALRMFSRKTDQEQSEAIENVPLRFFSWVGLGAGAVTALSGLGGGVVMVPAINQLLKVDLKKAIAVSTGTIPFFALPNVLWYLWQTPATYPQGAPAHIGYVVPTLVLPIVAGILIGAPRGVQFANRLTLARLRVLFVLLLVVISAKMVYGW